MNVLMPIVTQYQLLQRNANCYIITIVMKVPQQLTVSSAIYEDTPVYAMLDDEFFILGF